MAQQNFAGLFKFILSKYYPYKIRNTYWGFPMKYFVFFCAFIGQLVTFTSAFADSRIKPNSVTSVVGITNFDGSSNLRNSPTIGVKVDHQIHSSTAGLASLEGAINYSRLQSKLGGGGADAYMLRLGMCYSFINKTNLTPFLSTSIGTELVSGNSPINTAPFITIGAGATYSINRELAVRADVNRLFVVDVHGNSGLEVTVGIRYAFDNRLRK